ncbi:hypothetical protein [Alishewanella sp. SMS8]|uniref:hypothetical protein n=1 Tax=Alishewanella sp. SMS8 TaxID=2994676 RepID=UPI0027411306|nr:hypothetical protein [Alishewanella sp. SMS8]MDP5205794.1 hypothetical protein [Alishewanella sp. SMS9]MDP5459888.1 hypothetical protein [Alishewanella sp. SMS8]
MSDKAQQIQQAVNAKLVAAFPTATVKSGWASSYLRSVEQWPLITVAPIVTNGSYSGKAVKDDMQLHIQIVENDGGEPETLPTRLLNHLTSCRSALFSQQLDDRHNNWHGLLNGQPTEGAETRFIEPSAGQPYAALSIILTISYSQTME